MVLPKLGWWARSFMVAVIMAFVSIVAELIVLFVTR